MDSTDLANRLSGTKRNSVPASVCRSPCCCSAGGRTLREWFGRTEASPRGSQGLSPLEGRPYEVDNARTRTRGPCDMPLADPEFRGSEGGVSLRTRRSGHGGRGARVGCREIHAGSHMEEGMNRGLRLSG